MEKNPRYRDLDWIRTLVILNLIPFHAAWLIISVPGFSRAGRSVFATVMDHYIQFFSPVHMFLLFFISGASVHMALKNISPGDFLRERVRRLLIPLVFFMLVLFPVLGYFWPAINENPSLSDYLAFWPRVLLGTFYNPYNGSPNWGHLWFVGYLFIFSLIMLPLFLRWRRKREGIPVSRLAEISEKSGGIFIFAVPLILIFALLAPFWPFYQNNLITDWGYFSYNLASFVFGFIFMMDHRFYQALDRVYRISLLMGAGTWLLKLILRHMIPGIEGPAYNIGYFGYSVVNGLNTWFWTVGILGLTRKKLNFKNAFLLYFSRISYAFYIFHLVVMVAIGWYIARLNLGFGWEFTILAILSLAGTLLCCEAARRLRSISFLFGIKKSTGRNEFSP